MRKAWAIITGLSWLFLHFMITLYRPELLVTFSLPIILLIVAFYFLKEKIRDKIGDIDKKSARRFLAIIALIAYTLTNIQIGLAYIHTDLILTFSLPVIVEVTAFYFARTRCEKK